ncbi:hypothetical protein D5086_022783 [Populus alba]|uniref:Uncharacterized protein n=1 Tax=Populus alba TaxID=43335 RepID=A0ACC4B8H4_POPAL
MLRVSKDLVRMRSPSTDLVFEVEKEQKLERGRSSAEHALLGNLRLNVSNIRIGYEKTREKGQGSAAEMASLKRVKEESARDLEVVLETETARDAKSSHLRIKLGGN